MRRWLSSWLVFGFAAYAKAGEPTPRFEIIRLSVDGPAHCATESELLDRVTRYAPGIRKAVPGERARWFRVEFLLGAEDKVVARLHVQDLSGTESVRDLPAITCAEALDGAALVIALTLAPDPARSPALAVPLPSGHPPPAPAQVPSSAAALPTGSPPAAVPLARAPSGAPEQSAAPLSAPSAGPSDAEARAASTSHKTTAHAWTPRFALRATGKTGATPSPVLGALAEVAIAQTGTRPWKTSYALGLERTAAGGRAFDLWGQPAEVSASLTLAHLEVCVLPWQQGSWTTDLCATGVGGTIEANATGGVLNASDHSRGAWWGAAGAMVRGRIAIAWGLHIEAGGGVLIPFRVYHFELSQMPSDGVGPPPIGPFQADPVVGTLELGVAFSRQ